MVVNNFSLHFRHNEQKKWKNNSLDSLAHQRTISALSLYYRYYHGVCSVELKSIIPPKAVFTRNTRFSDAQHPFAVKLNKNRTSAYQLVYPFELQRLELTSQLPSSPPLITFSCLRLASTDTFNPYPAHKSPLLLFTMEGPTKAFRGCTFLVYLLLSSIS